MQLKLLVSLILLIISYEIEKWNGCVVTERVFFYARGRDVYGFVLFQLILMQSFCKTGAGINEFNFPI